MIAASSHLLQNIAHLQLLICNNFISKPRRKTTNNSIMIQRKTLSRRVTAESKSTAASSKSTMKTLHHQQTFPFKLYEMLEYACDSEFADSLFWSADGSVFIIHDKDVMMNDLAPMFFKQTKFRSFVSVAECLDPFCSPFYTMNPN